MILFNILIFQETAKTAKDNAEKIESFLPWQIHFLCYSFGDGPDIGRRFEFLTTLLNVALGKGLQDITVCNMLTSERVEQSSAIHMQFRECHEGHKPHAGLDPTKASTGVVWTSERACKYLLSRRFICGETDVHP